VIFKSDITMQDMMNVISTLSPANKMEVKDLGFPSVQKAILTFYVVSRECWTARVKNQAVMLLGLDEKNSVWMMFGKVDSLPISFYKELQGILSQALSTRDDVHGWIHPKNTFAKRSAQHFGAVFSAPNENGFIPFTIRREK
jgi:hypothetical protein